MLYKRCPDGAGWSNYDGSHDTSQAGVICTGLTGLTKTTLIQLRLRNRISATFEVACASFSMSSASFAFYKTEDTPFV